VLIGGWGTGHPLGVAGAGLASSIAVAIGTLLLVGYFARLEHYVQFAPRDWAPRLREWRRICAVGLPAGGEFLVLFMISAVIYWAIRPFGAHSQAGFGVGMRVMQAIFLPAMAVGFSVAPIVGQNFGAGHADRVREAFRTGALFGAAAMLVAMVLCLWNPAVLVAPFAPDPAATAVGVQYLHYVSWNFLATGFVLTCSGCLQGLGKTWPALWSSASRVLTFTLPVVWLSRRAGFQLTDLWITSITSVTLQALLSAWLVRRQLRLSLAALRVPPQAVAGGVAATP
jgi:Na+-driven multidrug efflux pump